MILFYFFCLIVIQFIGRVWGDIRDRNMSGWKVGDCIGLLSFQLGGNGKSLERNRPVTVEFLQPFTSIPAGAGTGPVLPVTSVGFPPDFLRWGKLGLSWQVNVNVCQKMQSWNEIFFFFFGIVSSCRVCSMCVALMDRPYGNNAASTRAVMCPLGSSDRTKISRRS